MNAIETVEFYETALKAKAVRGETLEGVSIEVDSFASLGKSVPFILIDVDYSDLETAALGFVHEYDHKLSFFCVVSAQNLAWTAYKRAGIELASKLINVLNTTKDYRVKIFPKKMTYQELMIGGLKCSGVIVTAGVKANHDD